MLHAGGKFDNESYNSRGMAVATRNVRDFEDTGIDVIDPWKGT